MGTFDLITLSKKQGWVHPLRQLHGDEITPVYSGPWSHKVASFTGQHVQPLYPHVTAGVCEPSLSL